jgi:hypothetical protein
MNEHHLEKAQKDWGFALDITLERNRLIVANDGFVTDEPIKMGKHSGIYNGFYYQFKRKGNLGELISVIRSIQGVEA